MRRREMGPKRQVGRPKLAQVRVVIKIRVAGQVLIPKPIKRHLGVDFSYVEILTDASRPDVLILKPIHDYIEPNICCICGCGVYDFKTFRGNDICLNCISIIDGSKVYKVKRVAKRFTKVKIVKHKEQSNIVSVDYNDWCIMCGNKKDIVVTFRGKNLCGDCKAVFLGIKKNKVFQKIRLS